MMGNKITIEMVDELNIKYTDAIFELNLKDDPVAVELKMKPKYMKYLNSCNFYIDEETRNDLISFFKSKNIDILFNNTGNVFWGYGNI